MYLLVLSDVVCKVSVMFVSLLIKSYRLLGKKDSCACFGLVIPYTSQFMAGVLNECYLVDPASSHMLFSNIKPCMCKYELIQTVKLRMAY